MRKAPKHPIRSSRYLKTAPLAITLIAGLLSAKAAHCQQLLLNGGFETGDFTEDAPAPKKPTASKTFRPIR